MFATNIDSNAPNNLVYLLGQSPDVRKLHTFIVRVAKTDEHVLVVGEIGTGKKILAEFIHQRSPRKHKALVSVNCTMLVEPEAEKELFGNTEEVGDTIHRHVGSLEEANGGTLLLENVEDLGENLQQRLAHVLREKVIRANGTKKDIDIDVRVISTTNIDLAEQVKLGNFRQDLFLILNSFVVEIPPLRKRKQDIPVLFEHFLKKHCQESGRPIPSVPISIFEPLLEYNWRGNVEELERCTRNLVLLSPEGELSTEFLPFKIKENPFEFLKGRNLEEAISELEKYLISAALRRFGGNRSKAAIYLNVSEATVRYKMRKYGIADEF